MVRLFPLLSLLAVAGASAQAAPQAPAPSPSPPASAVSSASAAVPPPAASSGDNSSMSMGMSMSMSGSAASATGSAAATASSSSAAAAPTATGSSGSNLPGYSGPISNLTAGSTISFGNHWAALHLDMINGIVASVQDTDEGKAFLDAAGRWLDATHGSSSGSSNGSNSSSSMTMSAPIPAATEMQAGSGLGSMTGSPLLSVNDTSIQPLNILTRIYFSNAARPELHPGSAFAAIAPPATESTAAGQLVDAIQSRVSPQDIVFAKTRYYAGAGNALEEILRAQSINTVVLSGIRTSGVILATASHLIDLDYIVYVLSDAVIETPSADPFPSNDTSATAINDALLKGVLPKLGVQVITVDDAIKAMQPASASGPAPAPAPAPAPSSAGTAAPTTYSGSASATATGDAAEVSSGSSASASAPAQAPAAGMPSPATAPYSPVRPSASSSATIAA